MKAPPKPHDNLAEAAVRLSRTAPNAWLDFMKAFSEYTDSRRAECIRAPADKVLLAQGHARECETLAEIFTRVETAAKAAK